MQRELGDTWRHPVLLPAFRAEGSQVRKFTDWIGVEGREDFCF